ncbi:patatin-like phospholipase family protein [Bacillus manliponensis]|uniref:patatin-like phospholipase family protein n=1 Tax=Bacillus manliponensis TaxID=574376 RepID=UPI0035130C67
MVEEKSKKLGLALSGGGFRAAFFHIGVLARMANSGMLRHVEVISTVSGGSIIGALYYLHVKKLLEEKRDDEITDEDYQEIIVKIEVDFLKAVQRNFRLRTFLNPIKNLRMSLPNYSRSDHIGELYDKYLYRHVLNPKNTDAIQMRYLKIQPCDETSSFCPKEGNSSRKAKVPTLMINATVLNNGHNWCFSAEGMGEPEFSEVLQSNPLNGEIDKNFILKKVESYKDICEHGDFELGLAVAASACLPGVFAPLAISNLYYEGVRVQLVDGGVHDNQGIIGLLDHHYPCTHFIISDASGQMNDEKEPGVQIPSVLTRTNSILMDRVREQQLSALTKEYSDDVAFLHLKKGLPVEEVPYYKKHGEPSSKCRKYEIEPSAKEFGVNECVQRCLSDVRTDLDSFSDVEAFSLMLDGYKMSKYEFNKQNIKTFIADEHLKEKEYEFFKMDKWVSASAVDPYYKRMLEASSMRFFRALGINKQAKVTSVIAVMLLFVVFVTSYGQEFVQWTKEPIKKGTILVILLLIFLLSISYFNRYRASYSSVIVQFLLIGLPTALVLLIGCIFIWIYLFTFDRLFLYLGRFDVFEKRQKKGGFKK